MSPRVLFFPVRHHSPAAALALRDILRRVKPEAVLVEGPSDFNPRVGELFLPHALPIAVYTWYQREDGERRGAYYPFAENSPEWQAALWARDNGAAFRFIDLPWAELDSIEPGEEERSSQRWADGELRRSDYVARLCRELSVDSFDDLWDELFEIEKDLRADEYVKRAGLFCSHSRSLERLSAEDREREAFMASRVRDAVAEFRGRIVVVTGGYHAPALAAALEAGEDTPRDGDRAEAATASRIPDDKRGIALTPYSEARLDALKGYEAGMPGPGFYRKVWEQASEGGGWDHRAVVSEVVAGLRARKQLFSSADLISSEATSRALAGLRGHDRIWRRDIVDGLRGALVKDDLAAGGSHPLLDAIADVFRGDRVGRLAEGVTLPPLVVALRAELSRLGLEPAQTAREVELDLHKPEEREKSRVLHRLRLLSVRGFTLVDGADPAPGTDPGELWEKWSLLWSPEMEATAIEASRYGSSLEEATAAVLHEKAGLLGRDAEKAAALLLDAALAGVGSRVKALIGELEALIRAGGDFLATAKALDRLIYLYVWDTVLEFGDREYLGGLLSETWRRALYLFEGIGIIAGKDRELTDAVRALASAFERCADTLGLGREELSGALRRVKDDDAQSPLVRGAALGALWAIGESGREEAATALRLFWDPSRLGDFLTGLFSLAREEVRRDGSLLESIDERLSAFAAGEFSEALPALRLAFTWFTPREKAQMAARIAGSKSERDTDAAAPSGRRDEAPELLAVSPAEAAETLAFEEALARQALRFGLRGGRA